MIAMTAAAAMAPGRIRFPESACEVFCKESFKTGLGAASGIGSFSGSFSGIVFHDYENLLRALSDLGLTELNKTLG